MKKILSYFIILTLFAGFIPQNTHAQNAYTVTSAIWRRVGNYLEPVPRTLQLRVGGLTFATSSAKFTVVGTGTTTGQTFATQNSNGTTTLVILDNGNVGIGTSTPSSPLQVTTWATNATTSLTIGKTGQTKGSCLELYRTDGSVIYASVAAGATAFTLTTSSCK